MKYDKIQERFNDIESLQFRAVDGDGDEKILEGYAVLYNTRSKLLYNSFYEVIEQRAFDDVLADENLDVVLNFNHNNSNVMARTTSGTLKLTSDDKGLFFRAVLPDVSYANDVYELVKRGDLFQNSFAFLPAKEGGYRIEQSDEDGIDLITIQKVETLRDVSVVTFPAYAETTVSARDDEQPKPEEVEEEVKREDEKPNDIYKKEFKFLKLN